MAGAKRIGAEVREMCVCVCVEGGLEVFEGTLAFTLSEVAILTWRTLNKGVT